MELEGKAAFVTGAAKGIGKAIAAALAGRGARVALVDVDADAGTAAAQEVDGVFVRADVSRASDVADAARATADSFGRLDILVNSAGIQRYGDAIETSEEIWDEVLAINLKSAFLTAKHCVPLIRAVGGGAIVNVGSVQGFAAQRGVAAYAASKGGLIALTRAMAIDFAPAIRVNCICPGSVDTPMLRAAAELFADDPDEAVANWGAMHPLGRVARADEVAEAAAFLATDRSSFITGAALLVDGGLLSVIPGT